jgi:hypothetical protein
MEWAMAVLLTLAECGRLDLADDSPPDDTLIWTSTAAALT